MSTRKLPFRPTGDNVAIAASTATASSRVRLAGDSLTSNVMLTNPTNGVAFFTTGDSGVIATTGGIPVLPGRERLVEIPGAHTHVACILAVGTTSGNTYAQLGNGGQ